MEPREVSVPLAFSPALSVLTYVSVRHITALVYDWRVTARDCMSAVMTADAARAALEDEVEARRASLQAVVSRNPNGKLAKRASVMLGDIRAHKEFVAECGGEQQAVDFVCARVICGQSVAEVAAEFGLSLGLVGAMFGRRPEYEAQLSAAQRWLAEGDVAETVAIADAADPATVKVAALQISTRFKRAGVYAPRKFGGEGVGVSGTPAGGTPTSITVNFVAAIDGRPVDGQPALTVEQCSLPTPESGAVVRDRTSELSPAGVGGGQ